MSGVVVGITMVAGTPYFWAAAATPWAWLPAEAAMRPLARASSLMVEIL